MTTAVLLPTLTMHIAKLWDRCQIAARSEPLDHAHDNDRTGRAFLSDVMDHCPDAFQSEEDIQTMMCLYPGRF